MELTLVAVVAVALFFDFTNGFHDTANSIATSVSTRALSPRAAVISAALLNVAGAFVSFEVAATVASDIVVPEIITLDVVLAGLVGAITWNLITWYFGLPSSSSHALIGGVAGSAFPVSTTHTVSGSVLGAGATNRLNAVRWGVAGNILIAWVLTIPCAGVVGAAMESLTRLPGGTTIVFLLVVVIAALAFVGRTWQTRKLAPSTA